MEIKRFFVLSILFFLSFALRTEAQNFPQGILEEFSLGSGVGKGSPIFLPAKIRGKTYKFVLDTGASHTLFDTSLRSYLGEPIGEMAVQTAGTPIKLPKYKMLEVYVGKLQLKGKGEVFTRDLESFRQVIGEDIRGIVGIDFLKQFVLQINFDNGKLLFLAPQEGNHSKWGAAIPLKYNSFGAPLIRAKLIEEFYPLIDTGANAEDFPSGLFDRVTAKNKAKIVTTLSTTLSGVEALYEARLNGLSVGPHRYKGIIFGKSPLPALGLSFLSRHLVTFDFPNDTLYLKEGSHFNEVNEADMSGLHLLKIKDQIVVYSLDKGSPADTVGIHPADIILKVFEKDAAGFEMWELRRLFRSGDGQKVEVTIKREKEILDKIITLKKRI